MSKQVTIDVEARFVDNMTGGAQNASKALDKLGESADKVKPKIDKVDNTEVKPKIDADDSKLINKLKETENKLRNLAGKVWDVLVKIKDSDTVQRLRKIGDLGKNIAGKTWRAVVKVTDYATAPLRKLKDMLFNIKTLVAGIMAGFAAKKLIAEPIGLADAYSGAKIGFSTLLGESNGQQMMDDLDAFAKATPFKTGEVISQTQRMIAMGWNADNIIEDMRTIGDAAAATGKGSEGLNRITLALAQIKSKGKLSTEELIIMMIYWLGSRGDSCEETHENNCVNAMEKRCA